MSRSRALALFLTLPGLLTTGCQDGSNDPEPSPCPQTVDFVGEAQFPDAETLDAVAQLDDIDVRLVYSDRPGDEACIIEAEVVLRKGRCAITFLPTDEGNGREWHTSIGSLVVDDSCPSWGLDAPLDVEAGPELELSATIETPDLVDAENSCYAGDVLIRYTLQSEVWDLRISGLLQAYVDIEATPMSLPCV